MNDALENCKRQILITLYLIVATDFTITQSIKIKNDQINMMPCTGCLGKPPLIRSIGAIFRIYYGYSIYSLATVYFTQYILLLELNSYDSLLITLIYRDVMISVTLSH